MRTANADSITAYFRTRLPVMLDGALRRGDDRGVLLRRARLSLGKAGSAAARAGLPPAEILRETLDAIAGAAQKTLAGAVPKTLAGAVPVGPRDARVWWDERVLDNLDDVLARLDDPRLVLRFYDITGLDPDAGRWHAHFDLDVELHEAGKTVHFWSADRTYIVDLGYVHADGRFLRLARTNAVDLPRDSAGTVGAGATATSRLRPAGDKGAAYVTPDNDAEQWISRRPDSGRNDREAELIVHMLYRAFLLEGPRALRRVPALRQREADVLRSEYAARRRRRGAPDAAPAHAPTAFLVQRLDAAPAANTAHAHAASAENPPAVVAAAPAMPVMNREDFARHQSVIQAARSGLSPRTTAAAPKALPPAAAVAARRPVLIRIAGAEVPAALFATSVFEAAKNLRESLAGLRAIEADGVNAAPKRFHRFDAPARRPAHVEQ